jgi:hypothetical protein
MTADEFWNASPFLATAYLNAHKLRQRQRNEYAWLQGMYVYSAVSTVVSNALSSRGGKKAEYIKRPVDLGLETEAEKRARVEREREKLIANLTAWKKSWDAHEKKRGEKP